MSPRPRRLIVGWCLAAALCMGAVTDSVSARSGEDTQDAAASPAPRGADADRSEGRSALSVLYLGNEAVLVRAGRQKILFDPFFEEDFEGNYTLVPDGLLDPLMRGAPPYDNVSAIFVSHIHPDHFSSGRTIAYLRAHPSVHLFSTREVYDALRAAGIRSTDPLMTRLHSIYVAPGQPPNRTEHDGLQIEAYPIAHGNRPLNHLAFRVTMENGRTVMHLGDAGGDDAFYAPHQADFDRAPLDLLLAPEWLLLEPAQREVLGRRLRARSTVGIHTYSRRDPAATSGGLRVFKVPGERFDDP